MTGNPNFLDFRSFKCFNLWDRVKIANFTPNFLHGTM